MLVAISPSRANLRFAQALYTLEPNEWCNEFRVDKPPGRNHFCPGGKNDTVWFSSVG